MLVGGGFIFPCTVTLDGVLQQPQETAIRHVDYAPLASEFTALRPGRSVRLPTQPFEAERWGGTGIDYIRPRPGSYHIRFCYDPNPPAIWKYARADRRLWARARVGPVRSNEVVFEVGPDMLSTPLDLPPDPPSPSDPP